MTHPHDNTWCRATAAIYAYWQRMFGRSPMADCCMALSWLVLAALWLAVLPLLVLHSIDLGLRAMNKPFVGRQRKRQDNVVELNQKMLKSPA